MDIESFHVHAPMHIYLGTILLGRPQLGGRGGQIRSSKKRPTERVGVKNYLKFVNALDGWSLIINLPTLHGLLRPSEGLNRRNHPPSCDICLQPKYFKTTVALRDHPKTSAFFRGEGRGLKFADR